jgi:hypothetical protein
MSSCFGRIILVVVRDGYCSLYLSGAVSGDPPEIWRFLLSPIGAGLFLTAGGGFVPTCGCVAFADLP